MAQGKVKIKLNQSIGGHRTQTDQATKQTKIVGIFAHNPGDVVEWDAKEAQRFVDRGIATIVE